VFTSKGATMKKILLFLLISTILFSSHAFSAVTTSDGAITLDFYEDTQSGIDNRWILDFNANDFDGPGGVEEIAFELILWNTAINFDSQYNPNTDYYIFGSYATMPGPGNPSIMFPAIATDSGQLATPVETNYLFYATPDEDSYPQGTQYEPIIGNFYIRTNGEDLRLTGPVGFSAVPEPMTTALFAFGAFLLKFITKRK